VPTTTTNVPPLHSADELISRDECEAILRRTCFGHLSLIREGGVHVQPIRYAYVDGWVYFRADPAMRDVITHHPWVVISVNELRDVTHVGSVIVRGGCYATEDTGSSASDAAAMRGIIELRDRATVGRSAKARTERTSTVFRVHAEEMQGTIVFVPCPAGERGYDEVEVQLLRERARTQTVGDDERADDDGMREPDPPSSPRTQR
jgi:nitroimidazol reductase NimA-like FMN-containing flavoprotein (pyridoxamine 5'-phosphate oxidase superfamily)